MCFFQNFRRPVMDRLLIKLPELHFHLAYGLGKLECSWSVIVFKGLSRDIAQLIGFCDMFFLGFATSA